MSVKDLGHPTQLGLQMTATLANSPAKLSQLTELRFKSQSGGGVVCSTTETFSQFSLPIDYASSQ